MKEQYIVRLLIDREAMCPDVEQSLNLARLLPYLTVFAYAAIKFPLRAVGMTPCSKIRQSKH